MTTIPEYTERITANNIKLGWHDDGRTVGDDLSLLHSEVSEMLEAYRSWQYEDRTRAECMHDHEPDWDDAMCHPNHICKPEGFGSEAADVAIRLMDICKRRGVDLDFEIDRKINFNSTRAFRHGGKLL